MDTSTPEVRPISAPSTVSCRFLPEDRAIEAEVGTTILDAAHANDIPVIVDAASMLPPRANLHRYLRDGADMVVFSGGKGVRGPQGTGILCGRADLIEAAAANGSPAQFLGRPGKVAKEEILGLVTALGMFVEEDEEAEMAAYEALVRRVVDALVEVPGLEVSLKHDGVEYLIPAAIIRFTPEWNGPSPGQVADSMEQGDRPIYLHRLGPPDQLGVDPLNLTEEETETIIRRLREVLIK